MSLHAKGSIEHQHKYTFLIRTCRFAVEAEIKVDVLIFYGVSLKYVLKYVSFGPISALNVMN